MISTSLGSLHRPALSRAPGPLGTACWSLCLALGPAVPESSVPFHMTPSFLTPAALPSDPGSRRLLERPCLSHHPEKFGEARASGLDLGELPTSPTDGQASDRSWEGGSGMATWRGLRAQGLGGH